VGVGAGVVGVGARVACRYMGGFPDWDEWQKKVECRCNIAQDEAYFYTKDIVRWVVEGDRVSMDCGNGVVRHLNKIGRHNFKIDFKPHV